jgi:1,2-diacylglycerol 3-beta-glucosyltransferase
MSMVLGLLGIVLLVIELALALLVVYLLLLTVAACVAPRRTPPGRTRSSAPTSELTPASTPTHRLLILIPAHNEEVLLPQLLDSLHTQAYPRALFEVHVIADNCSDQTAELARRAGAIVHERTNTELRGKGYALTWALGQLLAAKPAPDAIIILDADSIVSQNFLSVMDMRMARGDRAVQAYYAVRNPGSSWSAGLRYASLAVLHYLRPQGRMVLGGSVGLKGNGMLFAPDLLAQHAWTASLTEDIEFHMALILDGQRVTFAPDAVVWAEMPETLAAARSQNVRWERGRLEMARNYVPQLLRQSLSRRSFMLFDAAVEQLIPPFSVLIGAGVLCLLAALGLATLTGQWGSATVLLAIALVLGQLLYTAAGLLLIGAPRQVYFSLLYAPAFVIWKIWLYVRVLLGMDRQGWVRTARNKG